jgi:tetratricopeptide (TPR) repeat protein
LREPLRSYVEARAAASTGALDQASRSYVEALAAAPGNNILAANAMSHAVAAGDRALAVRAATLLSATGQASPEVRLTLLAEALRTRDWRAANGQIDRIAADEVFSFMAPVLRAWVAVGSRNGDPVAILDAAGNNAIAQGYIPEQRALIRLIRGRGDAASEFAAQADAAGPRAQRLRIAGAAYLARRGDRREALALLAGTGEPIARARALIEARRPVRGEISTASAGVAEFLARLALDLNSQEARPLALSFARMATFLAPENSETWLIVAELLANLERSDAALAALAHVAPDDPFAGAALDIRTGLLAAAGRGDEAIRLARAAAGAPGARVSDWTRLGALYVELDRPGEGATAYERAIAIVGDGAAEQPLWALWLVKGGAHERAGNWADGLAGLRRAYELAPEQPMVLNYLGYAQLERRENVAEATRLVAEAHRLAPDNAAIADSLGWAHFLAGDYPRAIALLEQAAAGEPADTTINEHLGDAYFRAGRRIEARFAWRAGLVHAEGADAVRIRAKIDAGLTPQLAAR